MSHSFRSTLGLCTALLITAAPAAHAQWQDALNSALGTSKPAATGSGTAAGGALGGLAGLAGGALPSLGAVGTGNLTGVLTYCAKNNYLGGGAEGIKDKLLTKLGGEQKAKADPGYLDGLRGMLGGNSGQTVDLSRGGLQKQVTEKVCDQVLSYGQSLL